MKRSSMTFMAALVAAATFAASHSLEAAQERHARVERNGSEGSQVSRGSEARTQTHQAPAGERGVPRGAVAPVRPAVVAPRVVQPTIVAPRVVRPYVVAPYAVRPYYARPYYVTPYYVRPYYVGPYFFRPHLTFTFGVMGYPVPYPYAYPYPVPVYGYGAPQGSVVVGPASPTYGGLALEISPNDADVYVDGQYVGRVADFDGTRQTLTLASGKHHIEVNAPGFEPMSFDVDVYPGQIVPFRGELRQG
jgi:PEGA domain